MTFRKRDNLVLPETMTYHMTDINGEIIYSEIVPTGEKNIGKYQDIESIDSGHFVPGVFRVNPVEIRKTMGTCTYGSFEGRSAYYGSGKLEGRYASLFAPTKTFGKWDTELEQASTQKALASLKEANAEVGVMLGELTQTLRMLGNPYSALWKFFLSKKTLRSFDLTADLWLQYRYGLMPLLRDIESIQNTLNRKVYVEDNRLRRHKKGVAKKTDTISRVMSGMYTCSMEVTTITKTTVTSNTSLYYRIKLDQTDRARWGLSGEQLPSIAWELVPYSFVVDWFLNVGRWLQALQPTPRLEFVGGCTSQKTLIEVTTTVGKPYWGAPSIPLRSFVPSEHKWTSETLIRHVGTPAPVLPALNPSSLNLKRQLDSLALIWSKIKLKR